MYLLITLCPDWLKMEKKDWLEIEDNDLGSNVEPYSIFHIKNLSLNIY